MVVMGTVIIAKGTPVVSRYPILILLTEFKFDNLYVLALALDYHDNMMNMSTMTMP